jgi:hypothetical protein
MRTIRMSNHYTGNDLYDVFDALTGEKLLNVYAVELLFSRAHTHARITFGVPSADNPFKTVTRVEVFDILKADLSFKGTPIDESTANDHPNEHAKRKSLMIHPDPRDKWEAA